MDEPEAWRWVWVGAAVLFGLGEMATPGSFFLAPFAIGAGIAAILAFADASLAWQWAAFVGISLATLFALRPLARRLDAQGSSDGVGARRLIGREGVVLSLISAGEPGIVRVEREEWRADSVDHATIPEGTSVRITEVEGTRVIVTPSKERSS